MKWFQVPTQTPLHLYSYIVLDPCGELGLTHVCLRLSLEFENHSHHSDNRFCSPEMDSSSDCRQFLSDPIAGSTSELLDIQPQELQFPFELRKQISCSLQLSNKTDNCVAFKVKTTNPKNFCVIPNAGVIFPRTTCDVRVTMQAQKEAPPNMQCEDKFLLQSVVARPGATVKDITPEMFNEESGHNVEECKLRVVYVASPQPRSPFREGFDEDASSEGKNDGSAEINIIVKQGLRRAFQHWWDGYP